MPVYHITHLGPSSSSSYYAISCWAITGDYSATSPPVIIKKNKERKKKELSKNVEEEIFGSIEEELETYRSIPIPRVLESLRDARHYKFDEVVTIL
jgi:hypothetical protein